MRFLSLFSGIEAASVAWEPLGWEAVAFSEIAKFPCHLLRKRYPNVKNLGSVSEITDQQVADCGRVDVAIGGFPCFPAGTLVLSTRGLVPIEDISVGDAVLTHKGRYRKVLRTGENFGPTVKLTGQGHYGLETTAEHPFYSSSYVRKGWQRDENGAAHPQKHFTDPEWVEARHMEGKFWSSPRKFPEIPFDYPADIDLSEPFWWMIGAFLGNGWTRSGQRSGRPEGQENGQIFICDGTDMASELHGRLLDTGLHWNRLPAERTVVKFVCVSLALRRWIDANFGKYAHGKRIPSWLLGLDERARRAVYDGYKFTDGCHTQGEDKFSTVSRNLSVGVRLLAQSLGYSVSECRVENNRECVIEGRRVEEHPSYQVISRDNRGKRRSSSVEINGHRFGLVRSVVETGCQKVVYNIEVESDNSYTADGIVVHNCQDVSVAGARKGLVNDNGELTRSGLFFDAMRVVRSVRRHCGARFLVIENVPGLFSSNEGRDFAAVVGEMAGLELNVPEGGWRNSGVAVGSEGLVEWATLDARHFGVPQRRRRVFLVADFGDWAGRPPILLEREGMFGNPPTRGKARKGSAAVSEGIPGIGRASTGEVSHCLNAGGMGRIDYETETLVAFQTRGSNIDVGDIAGTIGTNADRASGSAPMVAFNLRGREGGSQPEISDLASLRAGSGGSSRSYVASKAVRRLTPIECARLQGFPDLYAYVHSKKKRVDKNFSRYLRSHGIKVTRDSSGQRWARIPADSCMYKAYGNSMAIPVMRWIGERIQMAVGAAA